MSATTPTIFDLNPKAQKAFEDAFNRGDLDYPAATDGQTAPLVIRYGDDDNAYLNINFENGEVMVRDGADPSGTAHRFAEDQWRTWTGQPSHDEEMEQVRSEQAAEGVGLEGLKTGETDDRTVDPADTARDR